jgi:hypothetical protein
MRADAPAAVFAIASTVFTVNVWDATVQAAANLAVVVTVVSGLVGWLAYYDYLSDPDYHPGDDPNVDREVRAAIADAAGLGAALGFVPGIGFAIYVFFHVASSGLQL